MISKSDLKTAQKNLNSYKYIMNLKSLTIPERDILSKKYQAYKRKQFNFALGSIKNIHDIVPAVTYKTQEIKIWVEKNKLENIKIYRGYYGDLEVSGTYSQTDKYLIERQRAHLKSIMLDKKYKASQHKQQLYTINHYVKSKTDARYVIKNLKKNFEI